MDMELMIAPVLTCSVGPTPAPVCRGLAEPDVDAAVKTPESAGLAMS